MRLVTRKIRKGNLGLSMPNFNNIGNAFSNAVQPNLNFQSQMGDTTALSLVTNLSLGLGVKSLPNSSSSYVNPVGDSSTGTRGMSSKMSAGLGIAGQVLGSVSDIIPSLDEVHNSNDLMSSDIRGGVNKALMSSKNPWFIAAGLFNTLTDKTGGFTDASKGLGGANDALNMVASLAIPGAGWFTKKTMDYDVSNTLKLSGASYSGTLDKANTAAQNAGAKILFGKSKANRMIGDAILADTKVLNIVSENELALAGANNPLIGLRNQFNMLGGWLQGTVRYGRNGMSIQTLERTRNIISNMKSSHELNNPQIEYLDELTEAILYEDVPEYKNGGSLIELTPVPTEILLVNPDDIPEFKEGGSINVIPEGALHARKHNMDMEGITKKGIPVVADKENGEIELLAEIEKEEIIFRLEVTKKLEELEKKYYNSDTSLKEKDELALEAGKLLVLEILYNTMDNVNLIDKV